MTDMSDLFTGANSFDTDISEWDVSRVTGMADMFFQCKFGGDISKWDVSSVTDMNRMLLHGSSVV